VTRLALLLAAISLLPVSAIADCRLQFDRNVLGKEDRLAGFRVRIARGMVSSIAKVPKGWRLSIDNDPSWQSATTGTAIVGAAFLSGDEAQDLLRVVPKPDLTCENFGKRGSVRLTLQVYRHDRIETVTLSKVGLSTP